MTIAHICNDWHTWTSFSISVASPPMFSSSHFDFFFDIVIWLQAAERRHRGQPAPVPVLFTSPLFYEIVLGTEPTIHTFTYVNVTRKTGFKVRDRNVQIYGCVCAGISFGKKPLWIRRLTGANCGCSVLTKKWPCLGAQSILYGSKWFEEVVSLTQSNTVLLLKQIINNSL